MSRYNSFLCNVDCMPLKIKTQFESTTELSKATHYFGAKDLLGSWALLVVGGGEFSLTKAYL